MANKRKGRYRFAYVDLKQIFESSASIANRILRRDSDNLVLKLGWYILPELVIWGLLVGQNTSGSSRNGFHVGRFVGLFLFGTVGHRRNG